MRRWLSVAGRRAVSLIIALCFSLATPLVAQQASAGVPPAGTGTVPASAAATPLLGPRLPTEWQRWDPSVADERAPATVAAAAGSHTITVTTLVLVLAVIIGVLLIAN
jgi:hypothetical protein